MWCFGFLEILFLISYIGMAVSFVSSRCPIMECDKKCAKGYAKDVRGCSVCACEGDYNPCADNYCPRGKYCQVRDIHCIKAPCPKVRAACVTPPTPAPPRCPVVQSTESCPYGPAYDSNGCLTSRCHWPCEGVKCPLGKVCEPQNGFCIKAPCLMQPICVPDERGYGFWE